MNNNMNKNNKSKLKLLVIGIDAMDPKIAFDKIINFPTLRKLCKNGVHGMLEGYCYGYGSYDNWASLYTGLMPEQHGIIGSRGKDKNQTPTLDDIKKKQPFWDVLNQHKISVGMIRGLMTSPPDNINGYMLSGDPEFMFKSTSTKYPVFAKKDAHLKTVLQGSIINPPKARSIEQLGSTWEQAEKEPGLIDKILPDNYFAEFLGFIKSECDYYVHNVPRLFKQQPTDMIFFYLSSIDALQHFQWHEKGWKTIIKGYKIVDDLIAKLIGSLNPENIIILSDHGQEPFHMLFPNTPREVQEKAFGWKPRVWMKNGVIVGKGENNEVLTGNHAMNGVIIFNGKNFMKGKISGYRIIDIYPTILSLFNIKPAKDRTGMVMPVFKDDKKNNPFKIKKSKKIVLLQTVEVYKLLVLVNELYLHNRGCEIIIIGRQEYKNLFLHDPRINNFIVAKECELSFLDKKKGVISRAMIKGFSRTLKDADIIIVPYITNNDICEFRIEK